MGRGWVAAGWVAAGGGDRPATHLDGNGNGNGNNGNGNEPVCARQMSLPFSEKRELKFTFPDFLSPTGWEGSGGVGEGPMLG